MKEMRVVGLWYFDINCCLVGRWGYGLWSSCNFNGDGELIVVVVMVVKCVENIFWGLFVLYYFLYVLFLFWE